MYFNLCTRNIEENKSKIFREYKDGILYNDIINENRGKSGVYFIGRKENEWFNVFEPKSKAIDFNLVWYVPWEESLFAFVPQTKLDFYLI
jgi:hypothetical protein